MNMHFVRMEEWRQALVDPLWDADCGFAHRSDAGNLSGTIACTPVGPALVNAVGVDADGPIFVARDARRIASSSRPVGFGMSYVKRGHSVVTVAGRDLALGPGDICLLSGTVPFSKRLSRGYEEVLYLAPHAVLEPTLGGDVERVPCVSSALEGFGRVLALHVETLAREASRVTPEHAAILADSTHKLLGAVFGRTDHATHHGIKASSLREFNRRRALEVIARDFREPDLDPAAIAERCRFSLRYLHALFAGGESVSTRLLHQRLDHCRGELTRPVAGSERRTVGEIAFAAGFNNLAHFCRAFKARFGMTPSEARSDPRGTATPPRRASA